MVANSIFMKTGAELISAKRNIPTDKIKIINIFGLPNDGLTVARERMTNGR